MLFRSCVAWGKGFFARGFVGLSLLSGLLDCYFFFQWPAVILAACVGLATSQEEIAGSPFPETENVDDRERRLPLSSGEGFKAFFRSLRNGGGMND